MATVRLDNLIRPKQNNSPTKKVSEETFDNVVYSDLHLDLTMSSSGIYNQINLLVMILKLIRMKMLLKMQ